MLDNYSYAGWFKITAEAASPVRSGGTDTGLETVLRDGDGRAFIQGTSLTGACLEWMKNTKYKKYTEVL